MFVKKKSYASSQHGGTLILVALMFPILLLAVGISVDIARIYAVKAKAQHASDAALLGAVATVGADPDVSGEMLNLFNANYPVGYMGSGVGTISVTQGASGVYNASFTVTVPTTIMSLFGAPTTPVQIFSQVTHGIPSSGNRLELAMVLDNSGSMQNSIDASGTSKINALKAASHSLMDLLFGDTATTDNLHVSVVPYDIVVRIGTTHSDWMQQPSSAKYAALVAGTCSSDHQSKGFAFNRLTDYLCGPYTTPPPPCIPAHTTVCPVPNNPVCTVCPVPNNPVCTQHCDTETGACTTSCSTCVAKCTTCVPINVPLNCPPAGTNFTCVSNHLIDVSDTPPTAGANWLFRLPYENRLVEADNLSQEDDKWPQHLAPMVFDLNVKADINSAIDAMNISGDTRIPVGLMWGWFTLSPKWQGLWDSTAAHAGLPANPDPKLQKALILMTDGKNIFNGDDALTTNLCNAIKAQGITVYVVGLGLPGDLNAGLLQGCASLASPNKPYYYTAQTADQLSQVFQQIGDDINFTTLRLSQ